MGLSDPTGDSSEDSILPYEVDLVFPASLLFAYLSTIWSCPPDGSPSTL